MDIDTLRRVHRQHLLEIPYENIDVQLRRTVDFDLSRIYHKLVESHRGGWCYEMNGLLEWALTEIGFDVMRVNGGVNRPERGDAALGNHLVLLVDLDGDTWVADVGFGDGVFEPIPLQSGPLSQRGFNYRLEKLPDGYWRFHNQQFSGAPSFDFRESPADEALFRERCHFLQTNEESSFVISLICQRFTPEGYEIQLGRLAKRITRDGVESWVQRNEEELLARLQSAFGIDEPEVAGLWPRIVEVHRRYFPDPD